MKHEIGFKGRMLARSEDDGDGRTIEGVAVPFGDVIDVWGERETFDPDTVFEGLDSAKLYYQHDTLIGSITSGENREDGLHITARVNTSQGIRCRAVADVLPRFAQPAEPTLEDAYLYLISREAVQ